MDRFIVKIFLIFVVLGCVSGKIWYEAQFTDSIASCPDFKNEDIIADGITLGMTEAPENEEPGFGLSGPLCLYNPIEEGFMINLAISKETELGDEYMFNSKVGFCESMKDDDAPWKPMLEMMNINSCPVETACYNITDLVLATTCFKDLFSRDFCGEYTVELSITKELDKISCHLVQVAIVEMSDDE